MTVTTDPDPHLTEDTHQTNDGRERREAEELVESLKAGRRSRRWPVAVLGAVVGAE